MPQRGRGRGPRPRRGNFVQFMRLSSRYRGRQRSRRPTILSDDFMAGEPRAVSHIRSIDAAAEPTAPSALAETFYAEALRELSKLGLPFLLAGTYALSAYTAYGQKIETIEKTVSCPFPA